MYNVQQMRKNSEILELILKWRCLTLKNLKELLGSNEKDQSFRKRIYRLEKGGILKSQIFGRTSKVIYSPTELLEYFGGSKKHNINEDNIRHDSIVALVATSFLKFNLAKEVSLPHEYQTKSTWKHHAIEPDAILKLDQENESFNVALEVELWRKNRKRIFEKMIDYAKASEYDYVFYFFGDDFSFNSYVKRIQELKNDSNYSYLLAELNEKIILVLGDFIHDCSIDLRKLKIFHSGEYKKLSELLGEGNV